MATFDPEQEKARLEQEWRIKQQIAFAAGLFQEDLTVHTLLESLAEGVVVIDSSGTILQINSSAEKMFDYPKAELIGQRHALLIPERLRKVHEEHQAHYFEEPRARPMGALLELFGRRRDGSEFPMEISLSFFESANGILVLAIVSDITERKRAEDELKAVNADLQRSNRELELFASVTSHDLQEPLHTITSYTELLAHKYEGKLDEKADTYVHYIVDAAAHMHLMINDLLAYSRRDERQAVRTGSTGRRSRRGAQQPQEIVREEHRDHRAKGVAGSGW
jgi:PAS domain S-box-containing protein